MPTTAELAMLLGGSEDSFTAHLLHLMLKGDPGNRRRLANTFPREHMALALWESLSPATMGELAELFNSMNETKMEALSWTQVGPVSDGKVDERLTKILDGLGDIGIQDQEVLAALVRIAEAEQSGNFIPAPLLVGPFAAFNMIALLQLAWRAPGLSSYQREVCEKIAKPMQLLFGPPLDAVLAKGWDRGHDVDSEGRKVDHEPSQQPSEHVSEAPAED